MGWSICLSKTLVCWKLAWSYNHHQRCYNLYREPLPSEAKGSKSELGSNKSFKASCHWKIPPCKAVIDERPKSPIEKRKRNLKFFSPVSREERETWNSFPQFREEKEKSKRIFSTFERRKRNGFSILKLQEEKEKIITISPFSRREREILNAVPQFWEEKEKLRVHTFREEKEKSSQTPCF